MALKTVPKVAHLKLVYSTFCNAYWAKIERLDGKAVGNQLRAAVLEMDKSDRIQTTIEPDSTGAYTFLLVRTDPTARYCAVGSVTIGKKKQNVPGRVVADRGHRSGSWKLAP